ncbi:hypothetical protein Bca4012_067642 [Brassica carinata]
MQDRFSFHYLLNRLDDSTPRRWIRNIPMEMPATSIGGLRITVFRSNLKQVHEEKTRSGLMQSESNR